MKTILNVYTEIWYSHQNNLFVFMKKQIFSFLFIAPFFASFLPNISKTVDNVCLLRSVLLLPLPFKPISISHLPHTSPHPHQNHLHQCHQGYMVDCRSCFSTFLSDPAHLLALDRSFLERICTLASSSPSFLFLLSVPCTLPDS